VAIAPAMFTRHADMYKSAQSRNDLTIIIRLNSIDAVDGTIFSID
jgi:hypothetical protein